MGWDVLTILYLDIYGIYKNISYRENSLYVMRYVYMNSNDKGSKGRACIEFLNVARVSGLFCNVHFRKPGQGF